MDELINIAKYCDFIKIKYGQNIILCNAIYQKDIDSIIFTIKYRLDRNNKDEIFQYQIENFNFAITDMEVLVNKSIIDYLNNEIFNRLDRIVINYEV
jgi:hypothetical protein